MNEKIVIKWKSVHPDAKLPDLAHSDPLTGDTGYDVYAVEKTIIPPGYCRDTYVDLGLKKHVTNTGSAVVPTGLEVAYITPGYWFTIKGKSGLGFKYHLVPHFGVIDCSYRGGLGIKIYNLNDYNYICNKGDKIAQLVIHKLYHADMEWSDEKHETTRNEKGFGSTGL
jgi:dUTP pyrophosphatase